MKTSQMSDACQLAIVGGGIAGLSAALSAIEFNKKSGFPVPMIRMLEAEETLGGRSKTIIMPNCAAFNTGGHWHHGAKANPFYQWASRRFPDLSFREDTVSNIYGLVPEAYARSQGCVEITSASSLRRDAMDAIGLAYTAFKDANPRQDISLGRLAEIVATSESRVVADYMSRLWCATEGPMDLSGDEIFNPDDPSGPGGMQIIGGQGLLIDAMAEDLRAEGVDIRTGCTVKTVRNTPDGVILVAADGQRHHALEAICTVSAGVLQNTRIAFDPQISDKIKLCLDQVVMGTMTKICVPVNPAFFERNGIDVDTHIDLINGSLSAFFHARGNGASTISVLTGGNLAVAIEQMTRDEIRSFIKEVFDKVDLFKGYEDYAFLNDFHATGWNSNPLYDGAYTGLKVGGRRSDPIRELHTIFAGEAFVRLAENCPGTMAGAYYSGGVAGKMAAAGIQSRFQVRPDGPVRSQL